ncbi:phage holin family protein [Candidatus Saccharibacteria bacterium]|nr:phage holin family protein [Candidatus Saccharibacteria bacterium]
MQRLFISLLLRWVASSLGLWIAMAILGSSRLDVGDNFTTLVVAGLVLALVNMALKPILVVISFPAIILSLGLFMLVINGLVLLIASWLYDSLYVKNFGVAVVAGVILAVVNLLVSKIIKDIPGKD